MSRSKLATCSVPFSAKFNSRTASICKITPHYMAGDMGAMNCALYHRDSDRTASANYYIGSDGTICAGVAEEYRAWTSSSEWNDSRSITIEVASIDANGTITPQAWNALIALSADICKRHKIEPHYTGSTTGTITMHCMYSATACPGPYLTAKIRSGEYERAVKAAMNPAKPAAVAAKKPDPIKAAEKGGLYRLYNPNTGDHLLTLSLTEAKNCQSAGWRYEGTAWTAPDHGADVYRLVNPNSGHHHYCLAAERDALVKAGWRSEGPAFCSGGQGRPIYRLYNHNSGEHLYTVSGKEHDTLTKAGWKCEITQITY